MIHKILTPLLFPNYFCKYPSIILIFFVNNREIILNKFTKCIFVFLRIVFVRYYTNITLKF